jgi:aspartate aminotransferase
VKTHPENAWRLVPDELERLCEIDPERPRIVILNYPANPTGATYSTERLKKLAEVARKYKVILISDEIYGELHFAGKHVSIARFYPEGTIVSGGLSKWCGAGGWRLGTFTFPKELHWLLDPMASVASETFTATSAPIQYAAIRAYQGSDTIEEYLKNSRRVLKSLGRRISGILTDAGITHPRPDGAFYLFADFGDHREALNQRGIDTSSDLCNRLLDDTGVATLPGSNFGRPDDELTVRMAYVDFDGEKALKAVSEIPADQTPDDEFLAENCPKVMKAVSRICDWVKAGP